jgi:hypothetical protein
MNVAGVTRLCKASARQGGRGSGAGGRERRSRRSIAPLVLLAARAPAPRVVPLTRNSFRTLVTFTPCALPDGSPGLSREARLWAGASPGGLLGKAA